jgi:hypothetical protein
LKGTIVRKLTSFTLLVAVAMLAAAFASTASSATKPIKIAFTGSYSGQASTLANGGTVTISAKGNGSGTLIGAGAINASGTGDSTQQPCVPFGGTGTITGAKGTISFKASPGATGCGDEGGHNFTVKVYLVVTKATGKLAKAKGTLRGIGTYNRDDGSFQVKLTGTLKK